MLVLLVVDFAVAHFVDPLELSVVVCQFWVPHPFVLAILFVLLVVDFAVAHVDPLELSLVCQFWVPH